MSQKQQIINLLSDYEVHCTAHEMYMKDDRSRISELRKEGYLFDENIGTCKDLSHNHGADLKLRKLISKPFNQTVKQMDNELSKRIKIWNSQFRPKEIIKQQTLL